jgi:hypothetical protein
MELSPGATQFLNSASKEECKGIMARHMFLDIFKTVPFPTGKSPLFVRT